MNVTTKLFEKLCQKTLLYEAWRTVKSKNSAGGIDGMTISDFDEKHTQYMDNIINDLKTGKWSPQPNYSVFECMLTDKEFEKLRPDIEKKIDVKEDGIAYYPICLKCYTKIKYRLPYERVHEKVTVV